MINNVAKDNDILDIVNPFLSRQHQKMLKCKSSFNCSDDRGRLTLTLIV